MRTQEVYDARALRVIVHDQGGARLGDAIQTCYRLVAAVHKLWRPVLREFDDYIANPKPSGVWGWVAGRESSCCAAGCGKGELPWRPVLG